MAVWQDPIYDRTQSDIDYAIEKLNEWRINPPESYEELKGCFNISDINRIEQNTRYIADLLIDKGYAISITCKYDWTTSDTPIVSDIKRIINNINAIYEAFPISTFETLPSDLTNFEQINTIEKDLYLLLNNVGLIVEQFSDSVYSGVRDILPREINEKYIRKKYSGTFYSGVRRILPY